MNEPADGLDVLREILLSQDRETLRALQEELDRLKAQLDDPAALLDRIEPIIGEALARRTRANPQEVADALAPVMADALRRQIEENKDAFVAALVPIIGPLIARAVQEAFQALARRVDERIRRATSIQLIVKRWWARVRGIPPGELVLRDALPWRTIAVFIIDNESGLILAQSYQRQIFDRDPNLTAALLTAIRNFARETFSQFTKKEPGTLYELRVASYIVLMEEGPDFYVAWVGEGVPPTDAHERLQTLLTVLHQQYRRQLRDPAQQEKVQKAIESFLWKLLEEDEEESSQGTSMVGMAVVSAVLVLALSLCGWGVYRLSPHMLAYVLPTTAKHITPTPQAMWTVGVLQEDVTPYRSPDERAERLSHTLLQGSRVRVLDREGKWVHIGYPVEGPFRLEGWIPIQSIRIVSQAP